jgi:nucleoside-diphosphate-sugar epimerase
MLRIFLTGAAGFVGKHLWRHLLTQGHAVKAVIRPGTPKLAEADEADIIRADFTQLTAAATLTDCDAVIHLAARAHVLKESVADPLDLFRRVNVEGTMNLVRLAAKAGVRRFVFVSSIGVNGSRTHGVPFAADSPAQPTDSYAISKFEAEQALMTFAVAHGIEFVIVRPTLVYGPDAPGNFAALLKLSAMGLPLPFASFKAKRSLLAVWNLVDLLALCSWHPAAANRIFIAADAQQLTLAEILMNIGEGMGKVPNLLPFPPQLLHSAALLLGKGAMVKKLAAELIVDTQRTCRQLEWKPDCTTAEGLQRAGREYLEMIT